MVSQVSKAAKKKSSDKVTYWKGVHRNGWREALAHMHTGEGSGSVEYYQEGPNPCKLKASLTGEYPKGLVACWIARSMRNSTKWACMYVL